MPETTTLPEVVRRLDDVARSVERLVATLEQSYVRRDVYDARHDALKREVNGQVRELSADIAEIKEARKADQAFKRQMLASMAVVIVGVIINLVMAVANTIARSALG